jgi:hypothetical protein
LSSVSRAQIVASASAGIPWKTLSLTLGGTISTDDGEGADVVGGVGAEAGVGGT